MTRPLQRAAPAKPLIGKPAVLGSKRLDSAYLEDDEVRLAKRVKTMKVFRACYHQIDRSIVGFMTKYAIPLLRTALAVTYIWFGALKIFEVSPVAELVEKMSYGVPKRSFVWLIGIWEMVVGVALLFRFALRLTLALFFLQLAGTFLVFVLHPREAFRNSNPLLLTQTGEFIIKNLVLFAAGIVIGSTVRRQMS